MGLLLDATPNGSIRPNSTPGRALWRSTKRTFKIAGRQRLCARSGRPAERGVLPADVRMDTSYGADVASLRHLFFVGHAHELRGARAWHVIETLEAQCGCPLLHILSRKLTGGKPPCPAIRVPDPERSVPTDAV